jgi:hypothetical protein
MIVKKLVVPFEGQLPHGFAEVVRGLGRKHDLNASAFAAPNDVVVEVAAEGDDEKAFGRSLELFESELPRALRNARIAPAEGGTYNNYGQAGALGPGAVAHRNSFDARSAEGARSARAQMSAVAYDVMIYLANAYARGGFGNHKTWNFSRAAGDTTFPELQALGLIKADGGAYVLTDAGLRWAMANRSEGSDSE